MAEEKAKTQKPKAEKSKEAKPAGKAPSAKRADAPASVVPPTVADLLDDGTKVVAKPKKIKGAKNIFTAIAHVFATYNNTLVSITDPAGHVISWSSAGRVGFKGSRKSTAYAAQLVAQDAGRQAMAHGVKECEVQVKGPGSGRESAVRALQAIGLEITIIKDVTPIPHNGCRPPKKRRV